MVGTVEHLKLGSRGTGSGVIRLAYEVLDCTDATIEDWEKIFHLSAKPDEKPPLKAA